jgi:hypothetical protein
MTGDRVKQDQDPARADGEPREPAPPAAQPLPVRRPSQAGPAAPAPPAPPAAAAGPAARPAIQRPPPRWVQHPLPASLPRPLARPAAAAAAAAVPPAAGGVATAVAPPAAPAAPPAQSRPAQSRPAQSRPAGPAADSSPAPPHPELPALDRPGPGPGALPPRPVRARRLRWPAIAAAAVILAAAGVIAARLSAGSAPAPAGPAAVTTAARDRTLAAAWVAAQVGRGAVVACDPAMCAALSAARFPGADLQLLTASAADPLGADVVVATAAVRAQFGARLAREYAPTVLARFGTGPAGIAVRVVAPGGAASYRALLAADERARRQVAAQILANPGVRMSAQARAQVRAGRVDSRLLLVLPALAAVHPVQVLSFGASGPGADAAVPLRSAQLAGDAAPAGLSEAAYLAWLQSYLGSQRPPYDAQTSVDGSVVTVRFSSPSPLGLLGS